MIENKVLVIGDVMIDRYVYGITERISPEAPVPIVHVTRETDFLGGAGNVANNLRALGVKTYLAGLVGYDSGRDSIIKMLKDAGIEDSIVETDSGRKTTIKERIISGNNHQLLRLDYEENKPIRKELEDRIIEKIKKIFFDAVIISDYAKGMITERIAKEVLRCANKNKAHAIVDCKPVHANYYKGCYLITPNLKEAKEMTKLDDIEKMGKFIVKKLGCNAFIKRGGEGLSVFDTKGKHTHLLPEKINKIFDVTGAGDTVVAAAAYALISGKNLMQSAKIANYAAGLAVQKPGTSTVSLVELKGVVE